MKEQILENIYLLFRSHVVTAIIFVILIVLVVTVSIGVVKFNVIKAFKAKFALIVTVIVCSFLLGVSQIVAIVPVYKDYSESAYIVVEDAVVEINDGSAGVLDRINTVYVKTKNEVYELIMRTDLKLDVETEYVGTIAFLKHSRYIVWYEFE